MSRTAQLTDGHTAGGAGAAGGDDVGCACMRLLRKGGWLRVLCSCCQRAPRWAGSGDSIGCVGGHVAWRVENGAALCLLCLSVRLF